MKMAYQLYLCYRFCMGMYTNSIAPLDQNRCTKRGFWKKKYPFLAKKPFKQAHLITHNKYPQLSLKIALTVAYNHSFQLLPQN